MDDSINKNNIQQYKKFIKEKIIKYEIELDQLKN